MKKNFIFLALFSCLLVKSFATGSSFQTLIIGGGPAGLATALETQDKGASCLLVEKRACYTRDRTLFLYDPALKLLKKWQVIVPELLICTALGDRQIGIVQIQDLERALSKRADALGIKQLEGEFLGFKDGQALVATHEGKIMIPFSLVVGADGTHSCVRDALKIQTHFLGRATGALAYFFPASVTDLQIQTEKKKGFFIRQIKIPGFAHMVFAQRDGRGAISQKELGEVSLSFLASEGEILLKEKADIFFTQIDICLQQAETFANAQKHAILVGDAAATASFFQGMGLGHAFKTAVIAGECIEHILMGDELAFELFEERMQIATEILIRDSRYLFSGQTE
jgi:2-polyprenyl-6-methoxyphenol hydroxylase-like FAD-dependent oxidoreductase